MKHFGRRPPQRLESVADVNGDVMSIDGKLLRRALTKDGKMPCIVSAYSSRTKLVIGQVKADEKSNEIAAIPDLPDVLYVNGAIVTIDAAGCQKRIVRKILRRGAGYVISLKGNLQASLRSEASQQPAASNSASSGKRTGGSPLPTGRWLLAAGCWNTSAAGRLKVCMVESTVYDTSTRKTTGETRFFISSLPVDPKRALEAIRAHWGVEAMHWILDMDFDEDRSRARREGLAENLAMLRHVVINVLRLDKSLFGGISVKRKELTWDDDKLLGLMLAA